MFGRNRNRGLSMNDFTARQGLIGGNPATFTPKNLPQPVVPKKAFPGGSKLFNEKTGLKFIERPSNDVDEDKPTPESSKQEDAPVQVIKQINKERKVAKKQRGQDTMTFEGIKSKFLLHKNKSAFIRKHKDMIKKLVKEDQKKFITLAKEHFR